MLNVLKIDRNYKEINQIHTMYNGSFPDDERVPFDILLKTIGKDRDMCAVCDNEKLIGMYYLMHDEDLVYLAYVCVKEEERGKGYGSLILEKIAEEHEGKRIVADIEELKQDSKNYEQQKKRKDFYLKNGYRSTGTFYHIYNVDYELLSYGGSVSKEEWHDLILKHWGPRAESATYH